MEDSQIVGLYLERSEIAITETQKKYGNLCKHIAFKILGNHEDSDECVNDTYLKAWDSIPPKQPNSLIAYLGRITRNLALDKYEYNHAKKRNSEFNKVLEELEDCIPNFEYSENNTEGALAEIISSFLLTLDTDTRNVFIRRYWCSDTILDLQKHFDMSKSKVESMLFRTRNKLKSYLVKEGIKL